ncbi:MAG: Ig-like domain repeat protein [Methanobrevibacter sp.]|nr:Ig-like domain repeat protein [Methanobrevibacter sp.]
MNKKILMSFLLVVLIAISLGSVSAADASDVVAANATDAATDSIQPAAATVDAVQTAIDSAKTGDIVDISNNAEYNFNDSGVTINTAGITVDGKGTTTIKGYGDGNGLIAIKAQNVTIQGIKFIDTNPKNNFTYGGTTAGWGISASSAAGGVVKDCEFTDFNSGIVVMQTVGFDIENNKFNGGYSTLLANDPTVNKEQGSKSLNIYRQSAQVTVKNNTFVGPILDGVSIAQGSGSNQVIDNYFEGNCYSIYFGGASTAGSVIKGNTFVNCGSFKLDGKDWSGLPVISVQKSSDNITIDNNTFKAINNNVLIAAEKGNEAHGFPTQIGNINVTGNVVEKLDDDAKNITLFHVLVRDSSALEITTPINVTNNVLASDVKGVSINFDGKEIFSASNAYLNTTLDANKVFSNETLYGTTLTVEDVKAFAGDNGKIVITLKDSNGVGLFNKQLIITYADNYITGYTDNNGSVEIPFIENAAVTKYVTAVFLGEGNVYQGAVDTAKVVISKKATTLTAAKTKVSAKVKKAIKVKVTLKNGKTAIKGKKVTIKVNGKTFKATTNAKGVATISVKIAKKGTFKATFKFAGDSAYKASSSKTVKFTVK